jgi:hypothetical protein
MNCIYFNTHFRRQRTEDWTDPPDTFAIITAYPTTGQTWPQERIDAADQTLAAELRERSTWVRRLTGYDPATEWAEPGWAALMGFNEACDLGARFKQDAIYFVDHGVAYVTYCDDRRSLVKVAGFHDRLHVE